MNEHSHGHSDEQVKRLRATRGFLVDLDGTTYIDSELTTGASEFLELLTGRAIPHLFLSNNSSCSGSQYVDRLAKLGIKRERANVMTSGDATIEYLRRRTEHRSVCLIGTDELAADFVAAGFDTTAADPDCVVAAFDTSLTFEKLERACTLLFAGKPYYATHPDKTCITARGLIPDIAAIIAACEAVTGRVPLVIGKPEPEIVSLALEVLETSASETAIVGDQLDTDMTMGKQAGLLSVLVMTGETDRERLAGADAPDIVVSDLAELSALLS